MDILEGIRENARSERALRQRMRGLPRDGGVFDLVESNADEMEDLVLAMRFLAGDLCS